MRLDFYYFSCQCPLNAHMLRLLEKYMDRIDIYCHDFANDFSLAKEMNLFFPTLTVLGGKKRYYSPLSQSFLEQVSQGKYPEEHPYLPRLSDKFMEKIIEPISDKNIHIACDCCGRSSENGCLEKKLFLKNTGLNIYGFLHRDTAGKLLGGAEYLPAALVPYPIVHDEDIAFITCVYMSDEEYDYKSAPLKALEEYLKKTYKKVLVISDEAGVFPNGDMPFFIRNGYKDDGIIYEDTEYCRLHILSKTL